jgi:hypothetical protein
MNILLFGFGLSLSIVFILHILVLWNIREKNQRVHYGRFSALCLFLSFILTALIYHHDVRTLTGCIFVSVPYAVLSLVIIGYFGYPKFFFKTAEKG